MEEYIGTKQARELLKVTTETLRNWDREGKITTIRTPSNARRYLLADIQNILGVRVTPKQTRKICYCRVSSKKQMDDLERQKDFFRSTYPDHELVTDIGSGLNWKRKGLKTILDSSMSGTVKEVVVAHRDRLCRFAFELISWILERNGTKLLVLNQPDDKSGDTELTDDILSIIHVYSCRKMGQRRYKNSKTEVLPDSGTETEDEGVEGDESVCV